MLVRDHGDNWKNEPDPEEKGLTNTRNVLKLLNF